MRCKRGPRSRSRPSRSTRKGPRTAKWSRPSPVVSTIGRDTTEFWHVRPVLGEVRRLSSPDAGLQKQLEAAGNVVPGRAVHGGETGRRQQRRTHTARRSTGADQLEAVRSQPVQGAGQESQAQSVVAHGHGNTDPDQLRRPGRRIDPKGGG